MGLLSRSLSKILLPFSSSLRVTRNHQLSHQLGDEALSLQTNFLSPLIFSPRNSASKEHQFSYQPAKEQQIKESRQLDNTAFARITSTREKAGREIQGQEQLLGQTSGPRPPKIRLHLHSLPLPFCTLAPPWAILSGNSREAELKRQKILWQTRNPTSCLSEREEKEDDYVWEQDFQIYNSLEGPSANVSTQSAADWSIGESSRSSLTVSIRGGRHALIAEK